MTLNVTFLTTLAEMQLVISLAKQSKPFVAEKRQIGWRINFPVS